MIDVVLKQHPKIGRFDPKIKICYNISIVNKEGAKYVNSIIYSC